MQVSPARNGIHRRTATCASLSPTAVRAGSTSWIEDLFPTFQTYLRLSNKPSAHEGLCQAQAAWKNSSFSSQERQTGTIECERWDLTVECPFIDLPQGRLTVCLGPVPLGICVVNPCHERVRKSGYPQTFQCDHERRTASGLFCCDKSSDELSWT